MKAALLRPMDKVLPVWLAPSVWTAREASEKPISSTGPGCAEIIGPTLGWPLR